MAGRLGIRDVEPLPKDGCVCFLTSACCVVHSHEDNIFWGTKDYIMLGHNIFFSASQSHRHNVGGDVITMGR